MKLLILVIFLNSYLLFAQETPPPVIDRVKCEDKSVEVVFLNGVRNSILDARDSKKQISDTVDRDSVKTRISPNGLDDICYKYIYNQTEGYKDFLEVLAQKYREVNPRRKLS